MNFEVAFVPADQFARKRWWRPARPGAAWFYHTPAPLRGAAFLKDYSTLDPDVRPIVKMLHSMGLPTLPSCSGHWPLKKWTQRCYDALLGDADHIRGAGLDLLDVENGARVRLRDPFWDLPWFSWQDMHEEMIRFNGDGYIGFLLPPVHALNHILPDLAPLAPFVTAEREVIGNRLHAVIRVRAPSPMAQRTCWQRVQAVLSRAR